MTNPSTFLAWGVIFLVGGFAIPSGAGGATSYLLALACFLWELYLDARNDRK